MGIHNDNSKNLHSSSYITHSNVIRVPGIGFKLTSDGNYDIDNKKLTNVAEGTSGNHAINVNQMVNYISAGALDIQNTINFKRGSISIDNINSQISAADLNKLFGSNSNSI